VVAFALLEAVDLSDRIIDLINHHDLRQNSFPLSEVVYIENITLV
jgi:hypothetical protein